MPEMEARPPAENRHGGAPRGERPASWDAPRLTRADPSRLANATTEIVRLSALRPLLFGSCAKGKRPTRAQQRAAGTKKCTLFDIVNAATANGSCASRDCARSCPDEMRKQDYRARASGAACRVDGAASVKAGITSAANSRMDFCASRASSAP